MRQLVEELGAIDPEAYTAYLTGRRALGRFTAADLRRAIDFFQESIERDPDFAPAPGQVTRSYVGQR